MFKRQPSQVSPVKEIQPERGISLYVPVEIPFCFRKKESLAFVLDYGIYRVIGKDIAALEVDKLHEE